MISLAQTLPTQPVQQPDFLQNLPELQQEIPVSALESDSLSLWLVGGGILILLLIVAGILFIMHRNRKRRNTHTTTPEEAALQRLNELAEAAPDVRTAALELSMILRHYLSGASGETALFETHEEFGRRADALSTIPLECRFATIKLLDQLASYKYAGIQGEAPELVQSLMDETRQTILNIQTAAQKEQENERELAKLK